MKKGIALAITASNIIHSLYLNSTDRSRIIPARSEVQKTNQQQKNVTCF